jgi:hypothetical protein
MRKSRWGRFVDATFDFLRDFFQSWVIRVWGLTVPILSILLGVFPDLPVHTKIILGVLIFTIGTVISLLIFINLPRKYIPNYCPNAEDLADIRVTTGSEAIAREANDFARAHFGKRMGFSYRKYRRWRKKNPAIFAALLDKQGHLLGFIDVFPLSPTAGHAMLEGEIKESELTIDDIFDHQSSERSNHIHIASVVCCARSTLAYSVTLAAAIKYIRELYPARDGRIYLAVAGTHDGLRVLERFGFIKVVPEFASNARRPVYCLRSEGLQDTSRGLKDFESLIRVRLTPANLPK